VDESIERTTTFDRSKTLIEEEILEVGHLCTAAKHVLLTEAVLRDEEGVRETSKRPHAVTTSELTRDKTGGHKM
jgi:hypothetical protein